MTMNKKLLTGNIVGIATAAYILSYLHHNDSGHTGFSPYLALIIFIPLTLAGVISLCFRHKYSSSKALGVIAIILGLAAIGFLIYLDISNTLLRYEVWIERGLV